jgi:hypothetical protein
VRRIVSECSLYYFGSLGVVGIRQKIGGIGRAKLAQYPRIFHSITGIPREPLFYYTGFQRKLVHWELPGLGGISAVPAFPNSSFSCAGVHGVLKVGVWGVWRVALPPANTPKFSFSPALGRESDACFAGLSDFEKAIRWRALSLVRLVKSGYNRPDIQFGTK